MPPDQAWLQWRLFSVTLHSVVFHLLYVYCTCARWNQTGLCLRWPQYETTEVLRSYYHRNLSVSWERRTPLLSHDTWAGEECLQAVKGGVLPFHSQGRNETHKKKRKELFLKVWCFCFFVFFVVVEVCLVFVVFSLFKLNTEGRQH